MPECVEVVITGPSAEWAADLAQCLVGERLAACAHISSEVRSVYRWEGAIHNDPEARLHVHTRAALVPRLAARVDDLHEYDVPCLFALPMVDGLPAYLDWIEAETLDPDEPHDLAAGIVRAS